MKPPFHYRGAQRQQGVSLIELMVGLTVGLIIVMAAGAMYITNLLSARDTGASLRLNSEVRMAMDVMIDEIRRAGYSPGNTPATNPFMAAGTDLRVNAAGTCVEFAYDANGNGVVDDGSGAAPSEYFGFRITSGILETRTGGDQALNDCDTGTWNQLTTPAFVTLSPTGSTPYFSIGYQCMDTTSNTPSTASVAERCLTSANSFNSLPSGTNTNLLETRTVTVSFTATSPVESTFRAVAQQSVWVRNNRVIPVQVP